MFVFCLSTELFNGIANKCKFPLYRQILKSFCHLEIYNIPHSDKTQHHIITISLQKVCQTLFLKLETNAAHILLFARFISGLHLHHHTIVERVQIDFSIHYNNLSSLYMDICLLRKVQGTVLLKDLRTHL